MKILPTFCLFLLLGCGGASTPGAAISAAECADAVPTACAQAAECFLDPVTRGCVARSSLEWVHRDAEECAVSGEAACHAIEGCAFWPERGCHPADDFAWGRAAEVACHGAGASECREITGCFFDASASECRAATSYCEFLRSDRAYCGRCPDGRYSGCVPPPPMECPPDLATAQALEVDCGVQGNINMSHCAYATPPLDPATAALPAEPHSAPWTPQTSCRCVHVSAFERPECPTGINRPPEDEAWRMRRELTSAYRWSCEPYPPPFDATRDCGPPPP